MVSGRDTLVVMPTGSGKSAIYQIAAMMLPGSVIVVSPLIALQKDQADSIAKQELTTAAAINSTCHVSEVKETFENLESGELKCVFLAPEQLSKPETAATLLKSAAIAIRGG